MNAFPDKLKLTPAGFNASGDRLFRLIGPFAYISSFGVITVPFGFITDGASIPRVFWPILEPFGPYFEAALIHDFLYSPWNKKFTRKQSDLIFKEAMFNSGLDWLRRETIYRAVRLGGWLSFKGNPPT